jgi:polar amino acid transport system substrate-binding protein
MKISNFVTLSLSLTMSCLSFAASNNPLCPTPVRIGWEPYPPFQMEKPNSTEPYGIDVDLVKSVFKKIGCEVKYFKRPWKRQLSDLESGNLDILTSANKTAEREKFAMFLSPYMKGGNVMYVLKEDLKKYKFKELKDVLDEKMFQNKDDFSKFRLGLTRGYEYGDIFTELIKNKNFSTITSESATDDLLVEKAQGKRVGAFLGDVTVISYLLKNKNKSDIFEVFPAKVDNESILYFAFSQKAVKPELATKANDALKIILKDGTFKKILLNYISEVQVKNILL